MVINRPKSASAHEIRTEPFLVRWTLITIAILFLTIFVVLPLVVVFTDFLDTIVDAYPMPDAGGSPLGAAAMPAFLLLPAVDDTLDVPATQYSWSPCA